ncbi:TIGR03435 family protein [Terriglobus sp. RCC_193]|uniref:TIGR03435 family protein n=1 Tax=Terriglobus sp. RCC_193 TaxID=3239218 RepID=UPI0035245EFF
MRLPTICALFFAFAIPALHAHTQPIHIDVAAVHPHKSTGDDPSNRQVIGGRFIATATSVQTLIRTAFGIDPKAIVNAPAWTESELFDMQATIADHAEITTPEQFQQLILSLLQDQFGFRFHREQREGPVYWLVVDKPGKTGPALKETKPGTPMNMSMNGDRRIDMRVTNASMTDFAKSIQKRAGRTIEDHTGLSGRYDFQLRWATDPSPESDDATLFAVIREQLGLRLQSAKGPIEVIVVDNVNRPVSE